MSPNRCATVAVLALLVGSVASPTAAAGLRLIGADFRVGRLYDVDPATGAATNPRETGIRLLSGIAVSPGGTLYGMSNRESATPNSIYTIGPLTGASSLVGSTGLAEVVEGDLAFSPATGVLYGVTSPTPGAAQLQLFTVDTATGVATIVGPVPVATGSADLSGLEFTPDGRLLILETFGERLLTVDPGTAAVLSTLPLSRPLGAVAGLALDRSTGVLYAADGDTDGTNNLYRLDPATGVLTQVGPTGLAGGLASLAFVPEPGAATATLAVVGMLGLRRRRG